tara:strand:- start:261 stop:1076 length:816 start_codon:yes stop_codon:yes gene_type:complete
MVFVHPVRVALVIPLAYFWLELSPASFLSGIGGPMIIITATFILADPLKRPEAIKKAAPLQQATRDDEAGCQSYVFSPDPASDEKVVVFELWDDRDSLHAHFDHTNYFNMGSMFGEIGLAGADSRKWRVTACEPVYDDNKKARADFFSSESQAPNDPIVIAGHIDLHDPSEREKLLTDSIPFQLATRNEEPGCQMYVFSADPCREERVEVVEIWDDMASLAAHFDHENYFNMGKLIRSTSGRDSNHRKFRCDVNEPVYDNDRRARADFFSI